MTEYKSLDLDILSPENSTIHTHTHTRARARARGGGGVHVHVLCFWMSPDKIYIPNYLSVPCFRRASTALARFVSDFNALLRQQPSPGWHGLNILQSTQISLWKQ